jgi:hypothetical protein
MILKLSTIRIDGDTQVRVAIHQTTVDEYAELLESGKDLPPLTVFHDGAAYWLADGFHRYHAARKAGLLAVYCDVQKGTVAEARWAAVGANKAHGLRMSPADRKRAVEMALKLKPEMSDDAIAEHVGVDRKTVLARRHQVVQIGQPDHRIGKDGKRYPAPPPPPPRPPQRPVTPASPPPPPPTPPKPPKPDNEASSGPKDHFGRAIPEALRPLWSRRDEVDALKTKISAVRVALRDAREASDPLYAGMPQDVLAWLDNVYSELDNCKPHLVCPWCGGMSKTCKMCRGPVRGFVSKFQYDTFALPEMKAIVEKGSKPTRPPDIVCRR